MLPLAELRKLDQKGLSAELETARRDWLAVKLSAKMGQDKKSHLIKSNKRYIAQILTIMNKLTKESHAK